MARLQQCPCGSGKFPEALYDGYNIFMCYARTLVKLRQDGMSIGVGIPTQIAIVSG